MTYYQDNKEEIKKKQKEYYQNNREEILVREKKYYQNNREEILVKGKKYYQNNREEILVKGKKHYQDNREEILKRQKISSVKYREANREILLAKQNIYSNTERGFMSGLWNSIKRSSKRKNLINKFKDFDEFYNHWLEQKSRYGMKCPATGVEMTTIKGVNKPGEQKRTMTNISSDRILSTGDYSPENLIFTTWKYNNAKNNITPKMAQAFLTIVKERYGPVEDIE